MASHSVNDKGKRKVHCEGGEDDKESPPPKLATVCVVCRDGFTPSEKACYIRQCRCFYHRMCFTTAFESKQKESTEKQEESTSYYGKCVRCSRMFYWPDDVRKVYISEYNNLFILACAIARGVVAYPIAEEYEDDSEEDESALEYEDEDGSEEEDGSEDK